MKETLILDTPDSTTKERLRHIKFILFAFIFLTNNNVGTETEFL